FFFFFQAEDGIRDLIVTGVQTCALPIWCRRAREWRDPRSSRGGNDASRGPSRERRDGPLNPKATPPNPPLPGLARAATLLGGVRSEERRVGKECRCRRGADGSKKTTRRK